MECKYCHEKDEAKLLMRTTVVNHKIETVQICTSCLWERMTSEKTNDGNILPEKESIEGRVSKEPELAHSGVGEKTS